MEKGRGKNLVPSINKALDVIALLFEKRNLTFKKITNELQLPPSTCYNIVSTLEYRGVIKKDKQTNEYSLGMPLMKWGLKAYYDVDIRKIALEYLHELVELYNETATITVFNQASFESIVIDVVEGSELLRTSPKVGARYPLHVTGAGMCFLASLPAAELTNYFETMKREQTVNPKIEEEKIRGIVPKVKTNGYAVTFNELGTGAASVGAGITNKVQEIYAAISVSGPIDRMEKQIPNMIQTVKKFANEITAELYGN